MGGGGGGEGLILGVSRCMHTHREIHTEIQGLVL